MVLCAGFGTRLRPLTDVTPKPLVPLCGLPLLRYTFALLAAAGVREVVINLHYLAQEMERQALVIARDLGLSLQVSREPGHILGTGGGVKKAAKLLGEGTFFLLNGDMLFDLDLQAALAAHQAAAALATMVLAPYPRGAKYAAVELDQQARVRRIAGRGAPTEPGVPLAKAHFTGVHVLESAVIDRLPEGESDINRTAYLRLIAEGAKVHGFMQHGYWGDLGAPASLLKANLDGLSGKAPLARFRAAGVDPFAGAQELKPRIWVHPGARIDPGAKLVAPLLMLPGAQVSAGAEVGPGVVLGRDVRVDPGARVVRAVCWDQTHVASGEVVVNQLAAPGVRLDA